jgi:hypothetical protein
MSSTKKKKPSVLKIREKKPSESKVHDLGSLGSGSVSTLDTNESVEPVVDEAKVAEDLKRLKEQARQDLLNKYIEESCTRLRLHYCNGEKKEILVERVMENYADVQRAVAGAHPRSQQLFMLQFEDGERMRLEFVFMK